jgi:KDO2-lipid IV(A) lauroyltransferase
MDIPRNAACAMTPTPTNIPSRGHDLRHRLEYAGLRVVSGAFRLLPLEVATAVSAAACRLLAPRFSRKRHQRALANLKIAFPEKSEAERLAISLAHWENLGRVVAETMQIDRLVRDAGRFEIVNDAVFSRYRAKLGAAIGVTLHLGNWELAAWPMVVAQANPGAIYRSMANPYIDRYLRELRRDLYPAGLFGRGTAEGEEADDYATARLVTDYVRRGGRLGIVCDQFYRRGVPVPFFGRRTSTQPIAAIVARRVGARIWLARCVRVGRQSRFRVEIRELRVPRTSNAADDIRTILAGMLAQFEDWIRENPEQWVWSNRVWP